MADKPDEQPEQDGPNIPDSPERIAGTIAAQPPRLLSKRDT